MLRRLLLLLAVVPAVLLGPAALPAAAADDDALVLAERYSPVVVVRDQPEPCGPGEGFAPTAVETVLGDRDVVLRGPEGEALSAPTAADLAGKGEGWYLDLPGRPLDPGCTYETWFRDVAGDEPATVYARVVPDREAGVVVVQYWLFWVFNDWNDKHEGDWEMLQVVIPAADVAQAVDVAPESVAFAQHEGSETSSWTDPKLHRDGDHVVVYPGEGSHAAYYTQAQWFGKSAAAGFGCDSTQPLGRELRPEVVLLPDDPSGEFAWLAFTGRWGEKAPSFNNGPTGPATKTQWDEPYAWQVEEGRPDAVPIPTIGGPAVTGFCSLTEAASLLFVDFLDQPLVVGGVLLAIVVLLVVVVARTDFFDRGSRELDRERKAGQMAVAALDLVRRRPGAFWVPAAVVVGAVALQLLLAQLLVRAQPGDDLVDINGLGGAVPGLVVAAVASVLLLPVVAFAMATTIEIVDGMSRGEEIGGPEAFRRVLVHPGGWVVAVGVYILVSLLAATWWLLPVALWLLSRWAVALPATELEDRGVRAGLRSSADLTRGHRIRSMLVGGFLVWMAFSLPSTLGAVVLLATGWPFWLTNLVSLVLAGVLIPATSIGLTLLYYDLRARASAAATAVEPAAR